MPFSKSCSSFLIVAAALLLHFAAFVLAVHGLPQYRSEPPPAPPLSMSVRMIAGSGPAPPSLAVEEPQPSLREAQQPVAGLPVPIAKSKQPADAKLDAREFVHPSIREKSSSAISNAAGIPTALAGQTESSAPVLSSSVPASAAIASDKAGVSIPAKYAAGNRPPVYPRLSIQYREQGIVTLRVFVNADETAGDVEVKTSSGYPRLDQAAANAVET